MRLFRVLFEFIIFYYFSIEYQRIDAQKEIRYASWVKLSSWPAKTIRKMATTRGLATSIAFVTKIDFSRSPALDELGRDRTSSINIEELKAAVDTCQIVSQIRYRSEQEAYKRDWW